MVTRSPSHAGLAALLAALLLAVCAAPALAGSGWEPTGGMSLPTRAHGAALLNDGRVLVASGDSSSGEVPAAELYDPATGSWRVAAPPLVPRHDATATLLNDGRVLLAGGKAAIGTIAHAELYDPNANTWTATGALNEQREEHVAVLLPDGRVLVAGGIDDANSASATAEVYDPATGTWTLTSGTMSDRRQSAYAALLDDGRVLVAGGLGSVTPNQRSADLYDPATDSWSPTGALAEARGEGGTAVLPDGRVLVAGAATSSDYVRSIELYDPASGSWSSGGAIPYAGSNVIATALDDGSVLIQSDGSASTVLFDPATDAVTPVQYQASALRSQPSLTRLEDGRVLMAGGSDLASAELFTPPTERSDTVASGFGDVRVGTAAERDVTVENSGGNRLWIDGISLSGDGAADYAIVADACTGAELLPTERCVVRVRFTPSARGARVAALSFDDNAELSHDLAFDGAGFVPEPDRDGPNPPVLPTPEQPAPPQPQLPSTPEPTPRRAVKPPKIVRFALQHRCARPAAVGGRVRVGLELTMTRKARVQIEVARAIGTRGLADCPPRGDRRRFRGDLARARRLARGTARTAIASSVMQRHTLTMRLRPALYRITVRPYVGGGRLGRPVHRWLRVLAP